MANKESYIAFVLHKDGTPLMPIKNPARVRRLLKTKNAAIAKYDPFTIQLTRNSGKAVQPIEMCIDAGEVHIGISIKTEKTELVSEQRDLLSDEKERHDDRRKARRSRRNRKRHRKPKWGCRKHGKRKHKNLKGKEKQQKTASEKWFPPTLQNKKEQHIKLSDAQLLASLKLTVAYDAETGKYGITSIEDNDVLNTKRMFPEDRSSLVNTSVECLSNDALYPIISGLSEERLAQIKASAVVEQIPQPFNSTFYDTFGEVVSRTDFPTDWSYYAVNLYVMPHGVVTFYFISPTIVDRPVDELDLTAASFGEDIDDSLLEDIEQEDGTEPAEDVTTDEESTPLIEYNLIGYDAYDCQTQDRFAVTNPLMLNS